MDRLIFVPARRGRSLRRRARSRRECAGRHGCCGVRGDAATDIVVTGQRVEYGVRSHQHRDQDRTDIKNIPQALTIVSRSQIEDQQLRSVARPAHCSCPARPTAAGEGNRDQIVLRGNSSTADFFVDGVRDDVQYFRDFYNVDRVEVLKGPNAMIFGRGGGGGIVNRVLKRPTLQRLSRAHGLGRQLGRRPADRRRRPAARQHRRACGSTRSMRTATASATTSTSSATAINPTAAILAGPDTRIDLSYEYFHDRRTADRGVPADGDEPLRGYRPHLLRRSGQQLCARPTSNLAHARDRASISATG